jgi:hypothetical protein
MIAVAMYAGPSVLLARSKFDLGSEFGAAEVWFWQIAAFTNLSFTCMRFEFALLVFLEGGLREVRFGMVLSLFQSFNATKQVAARLGFRESPRMLVDSVDELRPLSLEIVDSKNSLPTFRGANDDLMDKLVEWHALKQSKMHLLAHYVVNWELVGVP